MHQAFVPRAVLTKDRLHHSIFLEGLPYHLLGRVSPTYYAERPDIIFVPGQPTLGSPIIVNGGYIDYSFDLEAPIAQTVGGRLQIVNRPQPSLDHRIPREGAPVVPSGIVECSINKTALKAREQLKRYSELFAVPSVATPSILIAGRAVNLQGYPSAFVPLDQGIDNFSNALRLAANETLDAFNLR